jgi:hypothetical protein
MDHDQASIDATGADNCSVTGSLGYTPVDTLAGGSDKGTQFFKAARIGQDVYPFPGRQFAAAVLPLDVFNTTAQQIFRLNLLISFNSLVHAFAHCRVLYSLNQLAANFCSFHPKEYWSGGVME